MSEEKREGTHQQYGPESGGHWKEPDSIRAAALPTDLIRLEDMESIIRDEVERERERCITELKERQKKWGVLYGYDVDVVIRNIRKGG